MGIFKNNKTEQQTQSAPTPSGLDGVAQVIAVASGKGGVGKSTVSTNLAVALAAEGAKVGLLDADIYGPSQPGMLGAKREQLDIVNERLQPIEMHNLKLVSMGSLIADDGPVVWRAPMATKMIMQFLNLVNWGELDYLVIDLPPGTGDVQLTLAQQAALTGAIIVTTPQNVALGVAKKGLRMFEQVNVPILGIVENMSGFTCSHCGQVTEIFKEGGGKKLAEETGFPYLGAIPLDPKIVESGESGKPLTLGNTDGASAKAFRDLATALKERLLEVAVDVNLEPQNVQMAENGDILISWNDGLAGRFTAYDLRVHCPCASCIDEDTGRQLLDVKKVPLDIKINRYDRVGRYALVFEFSDHHDTGIYRYDRLRALAAAQQDRQATSGPESFEV